jgi:hypothetical protein
MAVRTPRSVVPHLLGAIHSPLVRRYAPSLPAVHGPVLHILISTGLGVFFGVERIAHLANRLDDVAGVWRGRAAGEEVMERLAFVGLEGFKLGAVFELGAHSESSGGVQKR